MAVLQYAIDVIDQDRALWLAREALANGVRWIEAGHVLIKAAGIGIVSRLKALDPNCVVIADMKTMDMAAEEVGLAAKAGADVVMVCGAASDGVIEAAVATAQKSGVRVIASLMGIRDQYCRAKEIDPSGVDYILAHRGIDDKFNWFDPDHVALLKRITSDIRTPLAIGGGINESNYPMLKDMGFAIIISGRGITEAPDPGKAARRLVELASNSVGS
jgi:3-hexulose-6-phosphate synthase/6-phospho-3-hexuloisomerase